ncbi:MAG: acetyl-CoA carboxylase biotin carboxylase subunit [Prolixibacteraceae bacterium]|mgnify:CR=1 FL=1|jgi:acetyl-CoA carboxylase, biotin carboxylase subunit|nr:acetyl-CoA carboxylase biotin carboxylase subunit [Prolixibacteraceae bacterium]MBT6763418.1 acetyl-CoA carboxylase biotin carboxylase subunit [Prolixibacteraceae bacterium]MBT6997151.1 acetyl-CoA carboxylase biotin carboxylase subunit [Prolixibacteraceae bacterium]MBT7393544.1 acetyl-CoA carboxylase biotin carboxylase subunit [Prolixibacteraceae bacterium]
MDQINKVLIANRGEIAIRIMRTCRELDIETVAVYSEADRTSLHVRYAHEAYYIGKSPSSESYLNIEKIIDVAKNSGADAIHPGYGFLSENAEFAKRCTEEGITFIGPTPEVIVQMGDKLKAREAMTKAGIPVVPGTKNAIKTEEEALSVIKEIGLPVMIKASAGGGGKGMRLVHEESQVVAAARAARSEAKAAFGDDSVYIEKYINSPHHIEFQILADGHGNAVHLFERECSIQRRHQKMIEETPSPLMTQELRDKMGESAVEAAKAVNYTGAGTIEFLVDNDLNYYFLEMNTRLQVEHPITERVTGIDLVKQQIKIAEGQELEFTQEDLFQKGHSIECRIYAEDPDNNFMPSPGKIYKISEPLGLGVRTDGYVYEGYEIPIYYDSMISKLIVWGKTRDEAINRMRRALYEYKITGVKTSIKFLERIMNNRNFIDGKYDTHFIEKNQEQLALSIPCEDCDDIVIIAAFIDYLDKIDKNRENNKEFAPAQSRWKNTPIINQF